MGLSLSAKSSRFILSIVAALALHAVPAALWLGTSDAGEERDSPDRSMRVSIVGGEHTQALRRANGPVDQGSRGAASEANGRTGPPQPPEERVAPGAGDTTGSSRDGPAEQTASAEPSSPDASSPDAGDAGGAKDAGGAEDAGDAAGAEDAGDTEAAGDTSDATGAADAGATSGENTAPTGSPAESDGATAAQRDGVRSADGASSEGVPAEERASAGAPDRSGSTSTATSQPSAGQREQMQQRTPTGPPYPRYSSLMRGERGESAPDRSPQIDPVKYVSPEYPEAARAAGQTGRVVLRVEIGRRGRVAAVEVVESSGHDRLDNAAVRTIRLWRFPRSAEGSTSRHALEFELR